MISRIVAYSILVLWGLLAFYLSAAWNNAAMGLLGATMIVAVIFELLPDEEDDQSES